MSFRAFRCLLFPKPLTDHDFFFCRFLQQTGSSYVVVYIIIHVLWHMKLSCGTRKHHLQHQLSRYRLFFLVRYGMATKKSLKSLINEQGGYVVFLVLREYSFIRDFKVCSCLNILIFVDAEVFHTTAQSTYITTHVCIAHDKLITRHMTFETHQHFLL